MGVGRGDPRDYLGVEWSMHKKIGMWALAALLTTTAGVSHAAGGDPKAGQDKAGMCGGCHGFDGNSEDATFPRLAGQYADYIVKQIKDFQSGARANNETMAGMAAMVATPEDAKDIAAYFASQKIAGKPLANGKQVDKGEQLYRKGNPQAGVYACVNCHGERGRGKAPNVAAFPVIGGQHRDYLIKQLKEFRAGQRANDPAGMMSEIAKKLSDEDIEAVADYLSTLI